MGSDRIALDREKAIVFLGTMNAMPMIYALELRRRGYPVVYFVDVPPTDLLSRPESHYPQIGLPYPPWMVEEVMFPLRPALFRRRTAARLVRRARAAAGREIGCFVLSGFFAALAPFLPPGAARVGLSFGADLDVWANQASVEPLVDGVLRRGPLLGRLPRAVARRLGVGIVRRQLRGFASCAAVLYFPPGLNPGGDAVMDRLVAAGVRRVSRFDASFEPLRGEPREFKRPGEVLEIFSGVRFLFSSFPEGDLTSDKGNQNIIEGLARYRAFNPAIRVHFVEKGPDVQAAKELCARTGLDAVVVWHKETSLRELLPLYRAADICFDQVGRHWIGAIGVYALYLGKPVISNVQQMVESGTWPADHPVCSARNAEEVCAWLRRLEDPAFRERVSKASREFADAQFSPVKALAEVFELP